MKKFYMTTVTAVLALIFVFAGQIQSYAATYGYTEIKGTNNYSYTVAVEANRTGHYVAYSVWTKNDINVKWWIKDLDTGVTVKTGKITSTGFNGGKVTGLYGKRYRLYLKCDDYSWNNNKCNSYGIISTYQ
ncbi:hypothetical protein SAMN05444392_10680 [Seinonella peptonophila]|uniref:Uncharacterized protein n=1 Tax=Seinonella peptonophila TaxID=112248 RepID=A0A1M4Y732_9BACL|nr:hypothetical protein [Seinonella peptonophila]SHF01479.1 hypothetical protein SAMN05444392_10680 [Seinonella peptonophila]